VQCRNSPLTRETFPLTAGFVRSTFAMIEFFLDVEKLQVHSALPRRIRFPRPDETKLSAIQQR
jgi:hypothetical protein